MKKKGDIPRGHRLRATVVQVHRARHHKRFWFSVSVTLAAGLILSICVYIGVHDGTVHHLALAVLAERIALGLGGGGGEES